MKNEKKKQKVDAFPIFSSRALILLVYILYEGWRVDFDDHQEFTSAV